MKIPRRHISIISIGLLFCTVISACAQDKDVHLQQRIWDFEDVNTGQLPTGWKVEATNSEGPLATWQVIEDETAPSGKKVLALSSVNHESGTTFNLCWAQDVLFLDGEIGTAFKAVEGKIDQGGGVIWRAQDKDNYYIVRFNPLEDNFRLYYVRGGSRKMLASAQIKLPSGKWHTLKVSQRGDRILGYVNGQELIDIKDDTFSGAGGVGLWTKADAVTSFDDLVIRGADAVK